MPVNGIHRSKKMVFQCILIILYTNASTRLLETVRSTMPINSEAFLKNAVVGRHFAFCAK